MSSPCFRNIRARRPFGENLPRPCVIIDHPHQLREICAGCRPYSTDGPVCEFVASLADKLDGYAGESARILDPVWEHEVRAKFAKDKSAV